MSLLSRDFYSANGGLFSATNQPLVTYIFFAYKLAGNQGQSLVAQLPGWGHDRQVRHPCAR